MRLNSFTGVIIMAGAWASPYGDVHAQESMPLAPAVFGDLRGRWENTSGAGTSSGATTSVRLGVEAPLGPRVAALAELEVAGQTGLRGGAHDTGIALNRAQVAVSLPRARVVLGRQSIVIGDERFFGSSAFRNDQESFDALGLSAQGPAFGIEAYGIWRVHGGDGFASGGQDQTGGANLVRLSVQTPAGWLTAFRYDLDFEGRAAPAGADSLTYGLGLEGQRLVGSVWASWRLEAARQSGVMNAEPATADFARVHVSLEGGQTGVAFGQEALGAEGGAFQTPFASKRGFQGFAGQFSTTPSQGVRDTFLEVRARFGNPWIVSNVTALVRTHRFEDGRGKIAFGEEVNGSLAGSIGAQRLSVDYAAYEASSFGADTRRLWVTIARRF